MIADVHVVVGQRAGACSPMVCVAFVLDAYALAEPVIGLFKTELIKPGGPWRRTVEQVEIVTLGYVDGSNHRRLPRPAATSHPPNSRPPTAGNMPALTEAGHSTP